jgi:hypothetical protein
MIKKIKTMYNVMYNRYLCFAFENFTAESFSLNKFRIIDLYINSLWSIIIFIRYVLRIQYTPMRTIFLNAQYYQIDMSGTWTTWITVWVPFLSAMVAIAWASQCSGRVSSSCFTSGTIVLLWLQTRL